MELEKLDIEEIRSFDKARMKEVKEEISRELVLKKMDIYAEKKQGLRAAQKLKRNFARILTVESERKRSVK